MTRFFEYDKGRKYVKDMKMGKRWRVKGLGRGKKKAKKNELPMNKHPHSDTDSLPQQNVQQLLLSYYTIQWSN